MRILFVNYEFPPLGGGSATASRSLIREWTAMGCEVRVLTSHFRGLPWREDWNGVVIHRVPALRQRCDRGRIGEMSLYMLTAALAGPFLVGRWRPDAVISFNSIPSGPVAWWLKLTARVPYVLSLRGGDVPGFRCEHVDFFHRLLAPLTRRMWRDAAAVTANSPGLADLAQAFMPGLPVPVIPNGVDLALYHPADPDPAAAPAPAAGPRLMAVGRLVGQKGFDVLLDALARPELADTPHGAAATLDIVGDGDWRDALERQAAALGLGARVRFHGWVDRDALAALYRRADIFVLSSRDEGMPNVVLEAMASGLPVAATRVAGAVDLVVEGETGFLAPPEDPAALAGAIARLTGDPAIRRACGAAGRRRVEERFSWRAAAAAFLELAGGRPAP